MRCSGHVCDCGACGRGSMSSSASLASSRRLVFLLSQTVVHPLRNRHFCGLVN